jgi:hypothetical protein
MNQTGKPTSIFAIVIGLLLIVEGIRGLTSQIVFGVLTTNQTHAIIHIVLGIIGVITGFMGRARGFCIFLGVLLIAVGVLRFVPGAGEIVVRILNVNNAVALVNIVIGAIALIVSFLPSEATRAQIR